MSEVKVNKVSPRSGTGLQLGDSGDTITIPAGATITNSGTAVNFGATGSASWVTTVKTGDFTAVAGEGYFVNTTSGEIDVTLPASPSAGAVVAIKDYANTWDTNNCILLRNGSNIGGQALNSTLDTEGLAVTLVFVDATKGWLVTDSGLQSEAPGPQFITATGGTITTVDTNFKVHTFTSPGTFTVCSVGNSAGSNAVDYLVIAGGGGAGANGGGGGGAGGYRFSNGTASGCYSAGPAPLGASGLPVCAQGYPIVIGAGGTAGVHPSNAGNGANSSFSSITSAGGGFGITNANSPCKGGSGGSGGGSRAVNPAAAGNTPPTTPSQGNPGGASGLATCAASGGGGAGGVGGNTPSIPGRPSSQTGGVGGVGLASSITGSPVARASGATGGGCNGSPGNTFPSPPGGAGDGGSGGGAGGQAGTANTGGGGGGGGNYPPTNGGTGGSGVVIIRYKFQ